MTIDHPKPRIDLNAAAASFVACVLRQAGLSEQVDAPTIAPLRPARVVKDSSASYVAYSGGSFPQYEALEALLGAWLGAPKVNENKMGDMLIGRRAEFANGVSLVYMTERAGGITLTVPEKMLHPLAQHVVNAMSTEPVTRQR